MGGRQSACVIDVSGRIGVDRHGQRAIGVGNVFHLPGDVAPAAAKLLTKLRDQGGHALPIETLEGTTGGSGDYRADQHHGHHHREHEKQEQLRTEGHGAVPESQRFSKRHAPSRAIGGGEKT